MPPIDWSNPTVQGAWLAAVIAGVVGIVAAIGVLLGTVWGARIGANAANHAASVAREQAQADREEASSARQEAREDARRARFADNKRELYTALWTACDRHKRDVEAQVAWRWDVAHGIGGKDPGVGESEPARQAFLALTLLGDSEVVAAAERLYDATTAIGRRHAYIRDDEDEHVPEPDSQKWKADLNAWNEAAAEFESVAKSDLEVYRPRQRPG